MVIKKELKTETKIKAWVVQHDGKYYRVSQGIRPLKPFQTLIHNSIVSGRVDDYKNTLWTTRETDIEKAFDEYLESINAKV